MGFAEAFAYRDAAPRSSPNIAALTGVGERWRARSRHRRAGRCFGRRLRRAGAVAYGRAGAARRRARLASSPTALLSSRRARAVSSPTPAARRPRARRASAYPLILNTGRMRDQWHTMTRTAKTPRLMAHIGEPFVEIHPGRRRGAGPAGRRISRCRKRARAGGAARHRHRSAAARLACSPRCTGPTIMPPRRRIDALVGERRRSGFRPAGIEDHRRSRPGPTAPRGTRSRLDRAAHRIGARGLFRARAAEARLASRIGRPAEPGGLAGLRARALGPRERSNGSPIATPRAAGGASSAFRDGRLVGALFAAREPVAAARAWLADRLGAEFAPADRLRLLAGRPGAEPSDRGAIVCACFDVGRNQILEASAGRDAPSVAAIGAKLKAGTNCGSCRGEIARIVDAARPRAS